MSLPMLTPKPPTHRDVELARLFTEKDHPRLALVALLVRPDIMGAALIAASWVIERLL